MVMILGNMMIKIDSAVDGISWVSSSKVIQIHHPNPDTIPTFTRNGWDFNQFHLEDLHCVSYLGLSPAGVGHYTAAIIWLLLNLAAAGLLRQMQYQSI